MDYVQAWAQESSSDLGSFGIKIMVAAGRELTVEDKFIIRRAVDQIHDGIMAETVRLDPKTAEVRILEREEILALFPAIIFAEAIPNGYCSRWCCLQKPWYVITTSRGRIKIGWRKRVLEVSWDESLITQSAEELFPSEQVTKDGHLIHAWGYEKAATYIGRLLTV